MGWEIQRMYVRASTAAQGEQLARAYNVSTADGQFVKVWEGNFKTFPAQFIDLGTSALSAEFGEALYIGQYDGPSGELCGSLLYEHSVSGVLQRALVRGTSVWGWDEHPVWGSHRQYWYRVDGEPEPFEPSVLDWSASAMERELGYTEALGRD